MRGATKTRSRRREWLEPVALEADAEDLVAVYTSAAGRNPSVPSIVIQPLIVWWAATDRVWPMDLVEGLPTGGVGNAGLGLSSVGSTAKPSRGAFGGRRSTDRRLTAALRRSGRLCADIAPSARSISARPCGSCVPDRKG